MLSVPAALRRTTMRMTRRRPLDAPPRRSLGSAKLRAPPLPTVKTCPAPTCACADSPRMPAGLAIDRTSPLDGVMAPYAEQVLVCTGQDDWASKIEDEDARGFNLAADLKQLFGRGGVYQDPFHNVSVLNSSFPSTTLTPPESHNTSAYLLPSFQYVPFLQPSPSSSLETLARGFLLPPTLHQAHDALSPSQRDQLTRKDAYRDLLPGVQDVNDVLVLICGHGGRDARCGIMGPVLRDEFGEKLATMGVRVLTEPVPVVQAHEQLRTSSTACPAATNTARIGLVSHIGGHKFAGNVIIYLPPGLRGRDNQPQPLAGHGIWYGRVEPRHVEGLVQETILRGRVVADLFRGGIDMQRRILRI